MGGKAARGNEWLQAFWADLQEGARRHGEPPPDPEEVAALTALLSEAGDPPLPSDLVPNLVQALAPPAAGAEGSAGAVERPTSDLGAADWRPPNRTHRPGAADGKAPLLAPGPGATPPAPGLAALVRLLWAEVRYLPLSFFAVEALLLAAALAVNRYLAARAGLPPGVPGTALPWGELLDRSRDALVLVAPALGAAVALFSLLPAAPGVWTDLQTLSPFSRSTRFLVRAAVATLVALLGTGIAGLLSPSPPGVGTTLPAVILARTAPLLLAVGWALVWALYVGTLGAVAASLLLWLGLGALGARVPRWDLFTVPATLREALPQAAALAIGLACLAWAVRPGGRRAPAAPAPGSGVEAGGRP